MLAVCSAEPLLRNEYPDWAPRPDWRGVTKFETRAREEGRVSRDLMFRRISAA
jgi:tRNA (guanine-N7-)-methyltransferase